MTPGVLGIDPSLSATGIAHRFGGLTVAGGDAWAGDQRLAWIHNAVLMACEGEPHPVLAVVEDLPTHAHGAGKTGMAQAAVRLALMTAGVPYALMTAATLKKYATGNGNAAKPDLRMALYKRTGVDIRDDNEVDAAWLRLAGLDWLGHPVVALPKQQRAALDKVAWPETAAAT